MLFFPWSVCETAQSENYFALLSLLTPSAYSECGWGIPHILPRSWISLTGVAWTHQRNTSEVCVHAHSLSTESQAVSFEYNNRAWKSVPVSGHLLTTEACLLKQARACSTVQPVEQDSRVKHTCTESACAAVRVHFLISAYGITGSFWTNRL